MTTTGQSRSRSFREATRAVIATPGAPFVETVTCGFSRRFRNQAGWVSSPPLEATITIRSPSLSGEVSMTDRDRPDLRPVVINSSTNMSAAVHPSLPPLIFNRPLCTPLIAFRDPSLGMNLG